MDVAIPAQTIYSLFSGIGGLDESVRLAAPGSKTLCYVEREAFNCECERHDLLARKFKTMNLLASMIQYIYRTQMLKLVLLAKVLNGRLPQWIVKTGLQ